MKTEKIRPIAICIFHHSGRILVQAGYDLVRNLLFYRPLGGKIEFGESGAATVARELIEEIGQKTINIHYLGTLENIFVYNGQLGHEIVLIYDGEFLDAAIYQAPEIIGSENSEIDETGQPIRATWKYLTELRDEADPEADPTLPPVYPTGLLPLIRKSL